MKWLGGTEAHTPHKHPPHQRTFLSEGSPRTPSSPCEERVWARQLAQIARRVRHSQVPQTMADQGAVLRGARGHSPQHALGLCKEQEKPPSRFLPGRRLLHTFLLRPVCLASNQPAGPWGPRGPPWSLKELVGTSLPSPQHTAAGNQVSRFSPEGDCTHT